MPDSSGKTEKATPKKRHDERKKGNVFQSNDIITAFSIVIISFVLKIIIPYCFEYLKIFFTKYTGYAKSVNDLSVDFVMTVAKEASIAFLAMTAPVMLIAMAVGVVASGAQTKFIFSNENLKFKMSRMNPLKGIKNLFSMRSVVELFKSLIKIIIIGFIIYLEYKDFISSAMSLMWVDVSKAVQIILTSIFSMAMKIGMVFLGVSLFDYLYQWWEYERNIKMTKQEIKEEYKQTEGDPQIKGKIKDTQRKMANARMMQKVPEADVIIRNPTHIAVAIKYDVDTSNAPVVLAKGADYIAMKIIEQAEIYNIPMIENKPLARSLYADVELDMEVPPQYYAPLAEVLAWVYKLKKDKELQGNNET